MFFEMIVGKICSLNILCEKCVFSNLDNDLIFWYKYLKQNSNDNYSNKIFVLICRLHCIVLVGGGETIYNETKLDTKFEEMCNL